MWVANHGNSTYHLKTTRELVRFIKDHIHYGEDKGNHMDLESDSILDCDRQIKKLKSALRFCQEIAAEEYQYAKVGTGAEVALRHIMKKADEALGGG